MILFLSMAMMMLVILLLVLFFLLLVICFRARLLETNCNIVVQIKPLKIVISKNESQQSFSTGLVEQPCSNYGLFWYQFFAVAVTLLKSLLALFEQTWVTTVLTTLHPKLEIDGRPISRLLSVLSPLKSSSSSSSVCPALSPRLLPLAGRSPARLSWV